MFFMAVLFTNDAFGQIESCNSRVRNEMDREAICDHSFKQPKPLTDFVFYNIGKDSREMHFRARKEKNGLYGYLSKSGKWHIPPIYKRATDFDGDIAAVQLDEKNLVINRAGQVLADFGDRYVSGFNGGYAFILDGPFKYEDGYRCKIYKDLDVISKMNIIPDQEDSECAKIDSKLNILNSQLKEVSLNNSCDATFSNIWMSTFSIQKFGGFPCRNNEKWGIFSIKNGFIVQPEYDGMFIRSYGFLSGNKIGSAKKITKSTITGRTMERYDILYENGKFSFNRKEFIDEPPYDYIVVRYLYEKSLKASNAFLKLTGVDKEFSVKEYPFHFVGMIGALFSTVAIGVLLSLKGWKFWQYGLVAPIGGVAAGVFIGFAALIAFIIAIAWFIFAALGHNIFERNDN